MKKEDEALFKDLDAAIRGTGSFLGAAAAVVCIFALLALALPLVPVAFVGYGLIRLPLFVRSIRDGFMGLFKEAA